MELTGETRIAAARMRVWSALNDPALLARCIDGVESLEVIGENRFEGRLVAKVGPVRAKFSGIVELSAINAPNGYTISGDGKGGAAGFARGGADITLAEDGPEATMLRYVARAQVGGKLAQLGGRLIEGTARGYADRFFAALKAELEAPPPAAPLAADAPPADVPAVASPAATRAVGMPLWAWTAMLTLLVVALLLWQLA